MSDARRASESAHPETPVDTPHLQGPVQTPHQPVDNAGDNYADSTAATTGVAVVEDADAAERDSAHKRDDQKEIASTLVAVLGALVVMVALTAVG